MAPLRNRIRHHAVDSHARQGQRQSGEDAHKQCVETRLRGGPRDKLLHGRHAEDRQLRVSGFDGVSRRRDSTRRVRRRSHHQTDVAHQEERGRLLVRQIDCQGRFSQPPGFHVAYHPDNRATRSVGEAGVETPADGALAWPEASCYAFAHNHDARSVGAVALIEIAAVNDGDPEGAKIITCHHLLAGNDAWDCGRLSLDGDIATDSHVAGAQRQAHVPARRTNSRQRSKPLEHLLLELDHPSLILISRLWQVHIHGQDVFGIKTGIDPREVYEAARQQPRADQQDQ